MSASVFVADFNTYTVFLAATVPFVVSADVKVTVQYLFVSAGFSADYVGSIGPTTSGSCGVGALKYAFTVISLSIVVCVSSAGSHLSNS